MKRTPTRHKKVPIHSKKSVTRGAHLTRRFLRPFFISLTLTVGFFMTVALARPALAQTVMSQIRDILVTKAGFTFLNDASSDFLFFKQTDNYTAYAGDKQTAGGHRIRLTVDRYIFDFSLVDVSSVTLGVSTSSATPAPSDTPASSDEARAALDRVNALLEDIDIQSEKIDAMLKDAQTLGASIVSTAQLVETTSERMVLFDDVRPGTDIRYRLNEGGIKEEIVLNDPERRFHQFIFSFDTHGLVYKDVGGGVWYFTDHDGTPVFRIPKGWAIDEAGAVTNDVNVSIEKNILLITVNEQWLYAGERVFPITIDPTIEVVPEKRQARYPGSQMFGDVAGAQVAASPSAEATASADSGL